LIKKFNNKNNNNLVKKNKINKINTHHLINKRKKIKLKKKLPNLEEKSDLHKSKNNSLNPNSEEVEWTPSMLNFNTSDLPTATPTGLGGTTIIGGTLTHLPTIGTPITLIPHTSITLTPHTFTPIPTSPPTDTLGGFDHLMLPHLFLSIFISITQHCNPNLTTLLFYKYCSIFIELIWKVLPIVLMFLFL
jgi:hypothetical protein